QTCHECDECPAHPAAKLAADDLLHQKQRDHSQQESGEGEPDEQHHIVPDRYAPPFTCKVLKVCQDVRRVGEEDEPEERCNGDDYIDPFAVDRNGVCEICTDEWDPCQK